MTKITRIGAACVCFASVVAAAAGPYSLRAAVIADGGGRSRAVRFELLSVSGEPAAGAQPASRNFRMRCGFAPVADAIAASRACQGDVDGDRIVGSSDLQAVLVSWATARGDAEFDPRADFDDDGRISSADLQHVLAYWAATCP